MVSCVQIKLQTLEDVVFLFCDYFWKYHFGYIHKFENSPIKLVLHNSQLESLAAYKQSSLLGPIINYKENKSCEYDHKCHIDITSFSRQFMKWTNNLMLH